MIGRLTTAAAVSLLMAICSVCGILTAIVTPNESTTVTYLFDYETILPVVPTPSTVTVFYEAPSFNVANDLIDISTAPSIAVTPFADVLAPSAAVPDLYNNTSNHPPPIVIGDTAGLHGIGGVIIGGGGGGGGGDGGGGGGG